MACPPRLRPHGAAPWLPASRTQTHGTACAPQPVPGAAASHGGAHHAPALRPDAQHVRRVRPLFHAAELEVLDCILWGQCLLLTLTPPPSTRFSGSAAAPGPVRSLWLERLWGPWGDHGGPWGDVSQPWWECAEVLWSGGSFCDKGANGVGANGLSLGRREITSRVELIQGRTPSDTGTGFERQQPSARD